MSLRAEDASADVLGVLRARFATAPDTTAFVHKGRSVTYGAVNALIDRYRATLASQIPSAQVVAVVADFSPEAFCLLFALAEHECVMVPIVPGSQERSEMMQMAEVQWHVELAEPEQALTFVPTGRTPTNELLTSLLRRKEPGVVLFTSGSSGKPKAILHSFTRICNKFRKARTPVVAITFLMFDHFGGLNTLLAITSSLGTVVTTEERSIRAVCGAIERYKVTLLPTTPSFLTMLVRDDAPSRFDLSSLQTITYGTEVMPENTLSRLRAAFPGVKLQQTYGLSEVGVLRSQSRPDGSLWMRVGGEGFATKVVDGVLWIKSDYAMLGYLNAPSPFDADGWFNTEDRVEIDGDYCRILGRTTDLINIGGQKVYPAEIEDVILDLPNVADVAVYGEANALVGKIVVARVALQRPEPINELRRRIRQACADKLASFKVPAKVVIADDAIYSSRHKKVRNFSSSEPTT